jgi:adenylosuccinate synthase
VASVVIVGAQWGDEGKGKVVDLYTEFADIVVRYSGGSNAGHTLVVDGQKVITHLVPSGVVRAGKKCVLGDGMVIEPEVLLREIRELKGKGLLQNDADLVVSARAHVILPYHKEIDALREKGKGALGTTKRGIGPAYEAKAGRRGIRAGDLLREGRLKELLARNLDELNPYVERLGGTAFALEPLLQEALAAGAELKRYLADTSRFLYKAHKSGRDILFEGAQGTLLDVDHGTYPYVTSASTVAAGACSGSGLGPTTIDSVIGICKAYTTRVGGGPFPTELTGAMDERLRRAGEEFGATTGRPRRTGWLDVAALRYAVRVNGLQGLAMTKLDVLRGVSPIKVCVGYRLGGKPQDEIPLDPEDIVQAEPIYEEIEGFAEEIQSKREFDDLPAGAKRFVRRVEALTETPICLVSVGPSRNETIVLRNPFRG